MIPLSLLPSVALPVRLGAQRPLERQRFGWTPIRPLPTWAPTSSYIAKQPVAVEALQSIPDSYFQLRSEPANGHPQPALNWWRELWIKARLHSPWLPGNLPHRAGWFGKLQMSQERTDVGLYPLDEKQGLLYKPDGTVVGTINDKAEMRLENLPGVWDLYNNPFLQVDYQHLKHFSALGNTLLNQAFANAMANDVTPSLRAFFPGLLGQGQTVSVIDFDPNHVLNIQSIIKSPAFGLAPAANLRFDLFGKTSSAFQQIDATHYPKTQDALDRMILSDFLSDFYLIQNKIEKQIKQPDPPDVIVISLTMERLLEYSSLVYESLPKLLPTLLEAKQQGETLDPQLNRFIEKLSSPNLIESFQAVIDYVDTLIDKSPELDYAIQRYQALTEEAWRRGTTIVVSAGNSQSHFARGLHMRSDALLNFLGNSDHVILVGGSDQRQTPLRYDDDKAATFSNIGHDPFSHRGAPTLLAPALLLPIDTSVDGVQHEKAFNNGTSLAAPWVASIVALMKQANPGLSPGQIKFLLEAACENRGQLPVDYIGAGFLNPFKAIQMAQAFQQRPNQSPPSVVGPRQPNYHPEASVF